MQLKIVFYIRQDPEAEVEALSIPTKDILDPEATPAFEDDFDSGDEQGNYLSPHSQCPLLIVVGSVFNRNFLTLFLHSRLPRVSEVSIAFYQQRSPRGVSSDDSPHDCVALTQLMMAVNMLLLKEHAG